MYLDRFKVRFEQLKHIFSERLTPCSEDQIYSLERRIGYSLPEAYKEFLSWGGVWSGGFLAGSDCFYDGYLHTGREAAKELLKRDEFPYPFPEDAFVFYMHQGYAFFFFRLLDGDDPPVYFYEEGKAPVRQSPIFFEKNANSYSNFLIQALEEEAKLIQD